LLFDDLKTAFAHRSDKELRKARFIFSVIGNPYISAILTFLVRFALLLKLPVKYFVKHSVFEHFCGGETIEYSEQTIRKLASGKVGAILDYSVEGEESEQGFNSTIQEIIKTIEYSGKADHVPFCVFKMSGIGPVEVMRKVSADEELTDGEFAAFEELKGRVKRVCAYAASKRKPIMVDAEETWIQKAVDQVVYEMMEKYNKEEAIVFNTYQMYRRDALDLLNDAMEQANNLSYFLGAKLVRGAYMENERERSAEWGLPDPIHPNKPATDKCFNEGLLLCVKNAEKVSVMCASHNEQSNEYLAECMGRFSFQNSDKRFWFAQLYGMGDHISFNLAAKGYNVTKYVPYGPVKKVLPYLLRRAEENTSVAGQSPRELQLIKKEIERRKLHA